MLLIAGFYIFNRVIMSIANYYSINHMVFSFISYNYLEWIVHKIAHNRKWGGQLSNIHLEHHRLYSGNNIMKPAPYISRGGDIIFIPWISCIYISAILSFQLYYTIAFILETTILLWLSNYIHEQIHISNSWLEYNIFLRKWFLFVREKHFIHHKSPKNNMSLGGILYIADYTLGTYI